MAFVFQCQKATLCCSQFWRNMMGTWGVAEGMFSWNKNGSSLCLFLPVLQHLGCVFVILMSGSWGNWDIMTPQSLRGPVVLAAVTCGDTGAILIISEISQVARATGRAVGSTQLRLKQPLVNRNQQNHNPCNLRSITPHCSCRSGDTVKLDMLRVHRYREHGDRGGEGADRARGPAQTYYPPQPFLHTSR